MFRTVSAGIMRHHPNGVARMTKLLVSVRDPSEAITALDAGAHLIDVKEPRRGSLGAADPDTRAAVVRTVAGRVPVSAALGELLDYGREARTGLDGAFSLAKFGLAGCGPRRDWPARWAAAIGTLPPKTAPVAVIYADRRLAQSPEPYEVLTAAAAVGCRAMLIDTFDKRAGGLLDCVALGDVGALVDAARKAGLLVVLAGSLTPATITRLLPLAPDYVAVRGAACLPDRCGRVAIERVRQLVDLVGGAKRNRFSSFA